MATTIHHPENTVPSRSETDKPEARKTVRVIALPARFDAFADLDFAVDAQSNLVVDARFVKFADLHALQALVDARLDALSLGTDLLIGAPSSEFEAILDLTGFGDLLNVLTTTQPVTDLPARIVLSGDPVSYTHLTLPTNREV